MSKKYFIDTSVLIPAFLEDHPNYILCNSFLEYSLSKKVELHVSTHVILEFYAVLTRLPLKGKITPLICKEIISKNIYPNFKVTSLSSNEILNLINKISEKNLSGGIIYDLFHYEVACKLKVNALFTFNTNDFEKLSSTNLKIQTPERIA
ncbi:MAG: PIN domain-containing protein [Leptospiraceae bacterium]|nr:PIN domain-containing protein [Leptospiraceae bacterium]